MTVLSDAQMQHFHDQGYLVVENIISADLLARLRQDFDRWAAESVSHDHPYGECIDGRPRFDLQPAGETTPQALRRVQAPTEISEAFYEAMADSPMTDAVADLIGPNVKLHHTKINSKLPGSATEVKWHQDFPFTPHSNSDLITALLMIDEVTVENGPLAVMPGSHKGPLQSLWHDGVFTGAVTSEQEQEYRANATLCTGPAGSVCLMHTRLAHGSEPNKSPAPRTLFISVYAAGDAVALTPNPVPTDHMGLFVRGEDPRHIRTEAYNVEIPEFPKITFFGQQSAQERK